MRRDAADRGGNRLSRWLVLLAAILTAAALAGVAGCGGDDDSGSGSDEGGTGEPLKIGVNVALSGDGAFYGQPLLNTWKVLADEHNAKGGLQVGDTKHRIEVIADDNKWDPATIRERANKQILRDKVQVVTTAGDPQDPVIVPVTEPRKVILLDWTANVDLVKQPNKYVLNTLATPSTTAAPFYEKIRELHPDVKTAYGVGVDLQYDKNNVGWSKDALTEQGIEWLGNVWYPVGTVDFASILGRAVRQDPDMLVLGSPSAAAPAILKTLDQLNYNGVVASAATPEDLETTIKGAGPSAEGYYQAEVHSWPLTSELADFRERYTQIAGEWNALSVAHWIGAQFLLKAIQDAGTISDPDAIMKAAETASVPNPLVPDAPDVKLGGQTTYGQPRQLALPVALNQAKDDEPTTHEVLEVPIP